MRELIKMKEKLIKMKKNWSHKHQNLELLIPVGLFIEEIAILIIFWKKDWFFICEEVLWEFESIKEASVGLL